MATPKFLSGVLSGISDQLGPDGYVGKKVPSLGKERTMPGSNIKRFGAGRLVRKSPYLAAGAAGIAGGANLGTNLQENVGWYDDFIQTIASSPVGAGFFGGIGNLFASYAPGVSEQGTMPGAIQREGDPGVGLAALIDNYSRNNQMGSSGLPLTTEQLIGQAYNSAYDPDTKTWTAEKDPYLEARILNATKSWQELQDLMPLAQQRIAGFYSNAANQARQRAGIFGEQGERTAGEIGRVYTDAGQQAADLAGAGGTSVSGLTGPSQALQALYGTLPGTGTTGMQDVRAQTGFAVRTLEDVANDAARSGTAEGRNLANYISSLGVSERSRLNDALIADSQSRVGSARQEAAQYQLEQQRLAPAKEQQAIGLATTLWSGAGKNSLKDALEQLTGKEVRDEGQLYNALYSLAETGGWDRINAALGAVSQQYVQR
jgi:hypothetical protein